MLGKKDHSVLGCRWQFAAKSVENAEKTKQTSAFSACSAVKSSYPMENWMTVLSYKVQRT
jgi:hypothetical protein